MTVRYQHSSDVAWVADGGRCYLIRLDDLAAPPLALDRAATAIWLELEGGSSINDAASRLAAAFDVVPEVMHRDMTTLVADLAERGLVAPGPRDADP